MSFNVQPLLDYFRPGYTATFYMKSGQTITVGNIKEFTVKNRGGAITEYSFTWKKRVRTPAAFTVNLEEVEALIIQ